MGTESGCTGTTKNSFSIGDGGDGYKYIYANNSDVAQPGLRWNDDANQWESSSDGINWEKIRSILPPNDAQYIVLAASGDLTNERVLEVAAGELTLVDGGAGAAVTLGLAPTGVVAGTYSSANLTIDGYGRITNASNGPDGYYSDGYADAKYRESYTASPAPGGIIISMDLSEGAYLLHSFANIFTLGDGSIYIWLAKNGVEINNTLASNAAYVNRYWCRQIVVNSDGNDTFSINAYTTGTGYAYTISLSIIKIIQM